MVVNMAKLTFAVVTIAVLVTVSYAHEILSRLPAYVRLHSEEPFYVAESIDKIAGACVCLLVVWLMFRTGVQGVLRVLGLCASIPRALVFAVIASSPMLLGLALTRSLTPHLQVRRERLLPGKSACYRFRDGRGGTSSESDARLRLHLDSKPRNAAKCETTGRSRASRRAFDWQPRGHLGSAV